jgi:hypothetical protein
MRPAEPTPNGRFEPVLGRPPDGWPWALPNFYAVNTTFESVRRPIRARATSGGDVAVIEGELEASHLELIGYWKGAFAVVWSVSRSPATVQEMVREFACDRPERTRDLMHLQYQFALDRPVRYVMQRGAVIQENKGVLITGDWPKDWQFNRPGDISALCACIYERARQHGAVEQAKKLQALLFFSGAGTGGEWCANSRAALEYARSALVHCLEDNMLVAIDDALASACGPEARVP